MVKGYGGEIRQDGWRVMHVGDWFYQDGALRAESQGDRVDPPSMSMPIEVVLQNGDKIEIQGEFAILAGTICEHDVARLLLAPVVALGGDLMPLD